MQGRIVRVLVADARWPTRAGLRLALESNGCLVCAEADSASAALAAALRERPDICLIDTELPGDGIEAASAIAARLPDTPTVMFADSPCEDELFAAIEAGASGYLPRDVDPAGLSVSLRRAVEGEAALPRTLVAAVIEEFRTRARGGPLPRMRDLTSREVEVLQLLSKGLTTAEIADRLYVEKVTVRTHVASILKKLGVPDRRAAVRLLEER